MALQKPYNKFGVEFSQAYWRIERSSMERTFVDQRIWIQLSVFASQQARFDNTESLNTVIIQIPAAYYDAALNNGLPEWYNILKQLPDFSDAIDV